MIVRVSPGQLKPKELAGEVRFAIITDVHFGEDNPFQKGKTLGAKAPALLRRFAREMNSRFHPDFVISLGDVICDENPKRDKKFLRAYRQALSRVRAPAYFVIGNHDVKNLSDAELKTMLSMKRFYYWFDAGGVRCVVLYSFAKVKKGRRCPVIIRQKQLRWLAAILKKSRKPVLVFNHYPLDEQDLNANPYAKFFQEYPWRAAVTNRAAVRNILEQSKKVLAVFGGHLHWRNKNVIRAIPYHSIPSLTEVKHGAWAEVTVRGKDVRVRFRRVGI